MELKNNSLATSVSVDILNCEACFLTQIRLLLAAGCGWLLMPYWLLLGWFRFSDPVTWKFRALGSIGASQFSPENFGS